MQPYMFSCQYVSTLSYDRDIWSSSILCLEFIYFIVSEQNMIKKEILFTISIFAMVHPIFSIVCSTFCDYKPATSSYIDGCTGTSSTQCQYCDSDYFYLSGTQCVLNQDGIYNSTVSIADNSWTGVVSYDTYGTYSYLKFTSTGQVSFSQFIGTGVYGYKVRVTFIDTTSSNCLLYVGEFQKELQCSPRKKTQVSSYGLNVWMHTTEMIQHQSTSSSVTIAVGSTASYATWSSTHLGFSQVILLLAKCTQNCRQCYNLSACVTCNSFYYLNYQTKLCQSSCPVGQYRVSFTYTCNMCDPKCSSCLNSATYCQSCTDHGYYQSFYLNFQCYRTNCPSGYLENYETHICQCPTIGYLEPSIGTCNPCDPKCIECTNTVTNCSSCTQSGPYQSFYLDFQCYQTSCPTDYVQNYETHECQCPSIGYLEPSVGNCIICDLKCLDCSALATNCTFCTQSGVYESFLLDFQCYLGNCPSNYFENYNNHHCQCLEQGYFEPVVGTCDPCHQYCQTCFDPTFDGCNSCALGYYLNNETNTCSDDCPIGQYEFLLEDLSVCYICDSNCYQCDQNATKCTSCSFVGAVTITYLDHIVTNSCVILCPDGYQGNNVSQRCDQCQLGSYSFQNKCYSDCPKYYTSDNQTRSCTIGGGYPLNLTIQVQSGDTFKFSIQFPLKLRSDSLQQLSSQWQTFIQIYLINRTQYQVVNRLLQSSAQKLGRSIQISKVEATEDQLIIYSQDLTQLQLAQSSDFQVVFQDNLYSPKNVMYQVRFSQSTDNVPWIITQFYEYQLASSLFIGIGILVVAVIVYFVGLVGGVQGYLTTLTLEYFHMVQIIGLMVFSIYPHRFSIELFSYLHAINFSNLDFIYNIPKQLIEACYKECLTLTSFGFIQGDMDWLRLMGSVLVASFGVLFIAMIFMVPACSRKYGIKFLMIIIEIVILKSIHSWFASLIFLILNYDQSSQALHYSTHILGYLYLGPMLAYYIHQIKKKNNYTNQRVFYGISFTTKSLIVMFEVVLPLAPVLICALMLIITMIQWVILLGFNLAPVYNTHEDKALKYQQQPQENINVRDNFHMNKKVRPSPNKGKAKEVYVQDHIEDRKSPSQFLFHKVVLFLIKPLSTLLICMIVVVDDPMVPIIVISSVLGMLLLLMIINGCLLYFLINDSKQEESKKLSVSEINVTIQSLKEHPQSVRIEQKKKSKQTYKETIDEDYQVADNFASNKPSHYQRKRKRGYTFQ